MSFKFKQRSLPVDGKTRLCGIVNVTPDSFSDGGMWFDHDKAYDHALSLIQEGAEMLDIGGESTRPGSTYVPIEEEIRRVVPLIERLKKVTDVPIAIDTWKAPVAKAAIASQVDIINDITGFLGDEAMAETVANSTVGAILMFNTVIARPEHPGSRIFPTFGSNWAFTPTETAENATLPIQTVMTRYFKKSIARAQAFGIEKDRLMLDPGIGFGLTKRENLQLVQSVPLLHELGFPAFIGVSRKRFVVNILETDGVTADPETATGFSNRDLASAALSTAAALYGAEVLRVHTIASHRIARDIGDALRTSDQQADQNFGAYH
ncbi:MAG: dihydropteroate synthase [Aerococcus sp.]|nr:dihydropteroate synthase [Aerococcus sp.]